MLSLYSQMGGGRGDKRVSLCESVASTLTAPSDDDGETSNMGAAGGEETSDEDESSDTDSVNSLHDQPTKQALGSATKAPTC